MTIDELNALATLTAGDEIPVWDSEESGEPTKKITAQNMANSVKTLANLQRALTFDTTPTTGSTNPVTSGGIKTAIAQSTATLLKSKTVTISNSVAGASWSQTSRMIGTATSLFGIPASRIKTVQIRNAGFAPAAIGILSLYNDDVYVAATQSTTLSNDINVDVCYV